VVPVQFMQVVYISEHKLIQMKTK